MLRYMRKLESRDLSLAHSMIPLGSCTMKLNATAEMMPIHRSGVESHPSLCAALADEGLRAALRGARARALGMHGLSRDFRCSPTPARRANTPASSSSRSTTRRADRAIATWSSFPRRRTGPIPPPRVMAGMNVIVVKTDESGNIDVGDLEEKAKQNAPKLAALMVTYPSTHGVFEEEIKKICQDRPTSTAARSTWTGANMNAQVGPLPSRRHRRRPSVTSTCTRRSASRTAAGGPGMGPIGVAAHLAKVPARQAGGRRAREQGPRVGAVSGRRGGSASHPPHLVGVTSR